jgi:hypothetical protein
MSFSRLHASASDEGPAYSWPALKEGGAWHRPDCRKVTLAIYPFALIFAVQSRAMRPFSHLFYFVLLLTLGLALIFPMLTHATPSDRGSSPAAPIQATDADNRILTLNAPGMITVVIGTSPDSQDAARQASKAMNPFQGKRGFRYIVLVDLRHSFAMWFPSIALAHMRRSLDDEAEELKPSYVANGNHQSPRPFCYLVPDFKGTLFSQMRWGGKTSQLQKFQDAIRTALARFEESPLKVGDAEQSSTCGNAARIGQ